MHIGRKDLLWNYAKSSEKNCEYCDVKTMQH